MSLLCQVKLKEKPRHDRWGFSMSVARIIVTGKSQQDQAYNE